VSDANLKLWLCGGGGGGGGGGLLVMVLVSEGVEGGDGGSGGGDGGGAVSLLNFCFCFDREYAEHAQRAPRKYHARTKKHTPRSHENTRGRSHDTRCVGFSKRYSLFTRDIEVLFPTMRELGIGLLAYSPLSRGLMLKREFGEGDWRANMPRHGGEHLATNHAAADALAAAAAKRGCTSAQLALAWILAQGEDIVPIPGTTNLGRLAENAGAATVGLTREEADELRKIVPEAVGDRYAGMHGTWNSKSGAGSH
jgi:hypothetical protein